jgi:hypothetical protein
MALQPFEPTNYVAALGDTLNAAAGAFTAGKETLNTVRETVESAREGFCDVTGYMCKADEGPEIKTEAGSGSKRQRTTVKPSTAKKAKITDNQLLNPSAVFGDSLLVGGGEQQLTSLRVKLGKQIYVDHIKNFLEALFARGTLKYQYAKVMRCDAESRHWHFDVFRHNAYNPSDPSLLTWPSSIATEYLNIAAATSTVQPFGAAMNTPYNFPISGGVYYAPVNMAMLEDQSWNLNRFRISGRDRDPMLNNPSAQLDTANPSIAIYGVPGYSALYKNNTKVSEPSDPSIGGPLTAAPIKYNACINYGKAEYFFANKGTGGAIVEMVVFRKKRNRNETVDADSLGLPSDLAANIIAKANRAWRNKQRPVLGQYLQQDPGSLVQDYDVGSPDFPFLPNIRDPEPDLCDYVEVVRQRFVLPSGARRSVCIDMPGLCYDPAERVCVGNNVTLQAYDNYTQFVAIAVNGQRCTRQLTTTDGATSFNLGDMFASANVQYYCKYSERVDAMSIQDNQGDSLIYNGGDLDIDFQQQLGLTSTPITLMPQSMGVRTSGNSTLVNEQ